MQLTVTLDRSTGFTLLLFSGGGLAQLGFWSLPGASAGIFALIGAGYLIQQWWVHIARLSADSIVAVQLIGDNNWRVQTRAGLYRDSLQLLPGSFCHPVLVMFRLSDAAGHRYSLVVPADAVAAEPFRQLRVIMMQSSSP